jgi:hypothetical protein
LAKVTCPNCWEQFTPAETLFIASHPDLVGDPLLGPDEPVRFLPSRFQPSGEAVDVRGAGCHRIACPRCHLPIARASLEIPPFFVSVIGAPASGKSYFLAAMTWELKRSLQRLCCVSFVDADTESNSHLNSYHEMLFQNSQPERFVAIPKTPLTGDLYRGVMLNGHSVNRPRPLLFALHPQPPHPAAADPQKAGRVVCLYDNAGEHFLPGEDTASTQVTQHLARSRVIFFLFDPTQDHRFRELCRKASKDPQLSEHSRVGQQDTILNEMALRIRRYRGLAQSAKHDAPLFVIVTKSDTWSHLIQLPKPLPLRVREGERVAALDVDQIRQSSRLMRKLLLEVSPQIVNAAEACSTEVIFVPVSSVGGSPAVDPQTRSLVVRPSQIKPRWVTVPMLYALARWSGGLIAQYRQA